MIEDHLGKRGLERLGKKEWKVEVENAVARLQRAFVADYVVLGGGNAKLFKETAGGCGSREQSQRLPRRRTPLGDAAEKRRAEVARDLVATRRRRNSLSS